MLKFLICFFIPFVVFAETVPLETRLKDHILYDEKGPNIIGQITIDDKNTSISQSTYIYVKKAAEYYKTVKPKFIILKLNTPGGEVYAAEKISDVLKELDTQYNIPIVCFIDNWAMSAGAMLAYSCRFITVVKDGAMGAAEPLTMGEGGKTEVASEKINSALRADFASRASFFDRNPFIAEAMVDKDTILVKRGDKIIKLDYDDQIRKTGLDSDEIISPKGKLLTLKADQMLQFGVADILIEPTKLGEITESELALGQWPAKKSPVFQAPFFSEIPDAVIHAYTMDWKTQFLVWMASPAIASLLFLGLMISFYIELNTPGFGLAGSVAVVCLGMILISSYALEIANVLELVLVLMGTLFIVIDFFFLPTFGLLGTAGTIFFLIGLFGLMLPGIGSIEFEFDTQTFNAAGEAFIQRLAWLCGTLILSFIIMALLGRYVMPSFKGFRRFILEGDEQMASEGYVAGPSAGSLPKLGAEGTVFATLRPAGKVVINDKIYDAISQGDFIEEGVPIVVIEIDGNDIVVDKR